MLSGIVCLYSKATKHDDLRKNLLIYKNRAMHSNDTLPQISAVQGKAESVLKAVLY